MVHVFDFFSTTGTLYTIINFFNLFTCYYYYYKVPNNSFTSAIAVSVNKITTTTIVTTTAFAAPATVFREGQRRQTCGGEPHEPTQ